MEITVADRVVQLRPEHFFVVFVALMIAALASMVSAALLALASSGGFEQDALVRHSISVGYAVSAIGMPLFAFLFLWLSGIFKMKRDAMLCRSLAAANGMLAMAINVAGLFIIAGIMGGFGAHSLISLAGDVLSAAAGAVVLYLWLLIAMEPDRKRVKDVAWYSAIFAVAILLLWKAVLALSSYYAGFGEQAGFGLEDIASLAENFFFAFAILYHIKGKFVKDDAVFFAALYIGGYALYAVSYFLQSGIPEILFVLDATVKLALLYILAGRNLA